VSGTEDAPRDAGGAAAGRRSLVREGLTVVAAGAAAVSWQLAIQAWIIAFGKATRGDAEAFGMSFYVFYFFLLPGAFLFTALAWSAAPAGWRARIAAGRGGPIARRVLGVALLVPLGWALWVALVVSTDPLAVATSLPAAARFERVAPLFAVAVFAMVCGAYLLFAPAARARVMFRLWGAGLLLAFLAWITAVGQAAGALAALQEAAARGVGPLIVHLFYVIVALFLIALGVWPERAPRG